MATLNIVNNFSLESQGSTFTGKQGLAASEFAEEFGITVTGTIHQVIGSLATASVKAVYDDDDDVPADWDYLFFWADQDCYIQIIGSGTNVTFKVAAKQPFVLPGFDLVLGAADTTAITGGTEPTLQDVDQVTIGNYSGTTMNYLFAIID